MTQVGFTVDEYRQMARDFSASDEEIAALFDEEPRDQIERIEHIVDRNGGDFRHVIITGRMNWDMMRLAVATSPEYTDRCRVHPYFQDLLGESYRGVTFL